MSQTSQQLCQLHLIGRQVPELVDLVQTYSHQIRRRRYMHYFFKM